VGLENTDLRQDGNGTGDRKDKKPLFRDWQLVRLVSDKHLSTVIYYF
jgi:hypothetical protein